MMKNEFDRTWNDLNRLCHEIDKVRCSFKVGSSNHKKLAKMLAVARKMRRKADASVQ